MVRISGVQRQLGIFVTPVTLLREEDLAVSRSVFLALAVVALNEVVRAVQSHTFALYGCTVLRMPCAVLGNLEIAVQVCYLKSKRTVNIYKLPVSVVVTPTVGCACEVVIGCVDSQCSHQRHCKSK